MIVGASEGKIGARCDAELRGPQRGARHALMLRALLLACGECRGRGRGRVVCVCGHTLVSHLGSIADYKHIAPLSRLYAVKSQALNCIASYLGRWRWRLPRVRRRQASRGWAEAGAEGDKGPGAAVFVVSQGVETNREEARNSTPTGPTDGRDVARPPAHSLLRDGCCAHEPRLPDAQVLQPSGPIWAPACRFSQEHQMPACSDERQDWVGSSSGSGRANPHFGWRAK